GTEGTIKSGAYPEALQQIDNEINVTAVAGAEFTPLVERGINKGKEAEEVVRRALKILEAKPGIDTLIIGCTYYPLLADTIQSVNGDNITIIYSSQETAREVRKILDVHGLLYKGKQNPKHRFYTTGDLKTFVELSNRIFDESVNELSAVQIGKATIEKA